MIRPWTVLHRNRAAANVFLSFVIDLWIPLRSSSWCNSVHFNPVSHKSSYFYLIVFV